MKNYALLDLKEKLEPIKNKKLPITLSLAISRNINTIETKAMEIEEARRELIRRYGEKDEKGDLVINSDDNVKIENVSAFTEELRSLMEDDTAIIFSPISESDLIKSEDKEFDSLTIDEVGTLSFMIMKETG